MPNFHGSDIEKIASAHHVLPEDLINFGVNANPLGLSPKALQAITDNIHVIERYPNPSYQSLKQAIADYTHTDIASVLPANGTSELIHHIIDHFAPKRALLYTPTYSEYAKEVHRIGGEVLALPLNKSNHFQFPASLYYHNLEQADLVLLCNPNNPTTTLLSVSELLPLIEKAYERKIPFVIDETYIEFTENPEHYSAIPFLKKYPNLIILRGFSKFFSAPGLRLGYALLGDSNLAKHLQNQYPWGIHALAAYAGEYFLTDIDYIQKTKKYIHRERTRITRYLATLPDIIAYPTGVNFFLVELKKHNATDLFLFLVQKGLVIRNFHDEIGAGFFRFCIMRTEENTKLLLALEEFLKS